MERKNKSKSIFKFLPMKTFQLALLLICSLIFLECAKNPEPLEPTGNADETFDLSIGKLGLENWYRVYSISLDEEENLLISGTIQSPFKNQLVKLTSSGASLAEFALDGINTVERIYYQLLSDGNYLMAYTQPGNTVDSAAVHVFYTDKDLKVLFEISKGLPRDAEISDIIEINPEKWLIAGNIEEENPLNNDILIASLNLQDSILKTKIMDLEAREYPGKIIPLDGNYLFFSSNDDYSQSELLGIIIDESGNLVNKKSLGIKEINPGPPVAFKKDDEAIFYGQTTGLFVPADAQIRVESYDLELSEIWAESYGGENGEVLYDMKLGPNGFIYALGTTNSYGNGGKDIYLVKLDSNGTQIWDRTYGTSRDEISINFEIDQSGNLIIAGYNVGGGIDRNNFLLYLDSEGIPIE
jgi:hypothetical protein